MRRDDGGRSPTRYGQRVRRVIRDRQLLDVALAAGLGLWAQAMVWRGLVPGNQAANAALFLLIGWPLVVRRRYPLLPIAAQMTAVAIQALATSDAAEGSGLLFPGLVALYSAAAWGSRRVAWTGLALVAAGAAIQTAEDQHVRTAAQMWAAAVFWLLMLASWAAGLLMRSRRIAGEQERRAAEVERRHAEAVVAERSRIARELHDVIAHNMSVIVLHAVAAEGFLEREPERARVPLQHIEESGREALDELRRLLSVIRDGTDETRALDPQPGLADLGALVDSVRTAGVPVELTTEGRAVSLPRTIDLSAYRIVQEALTNTLRHAGPTTTKVTVRYGPDAVEIEVLDEGQAPRNGDSTGAGHGLVGMRERAALYNGSVEAGAQPGGGYRVHARLPVERTGE